MVLALVERIGKLEKDLYGLCHDDEEKVCRIERLEKETDWLARKLFEVCRNNDCGHACAGKRSCPLLRWKRCPVDGYVNSWREAARNLPWITVFDNAGQYSEAARSYNVGDIPTFFVYDRNGELKARANNLQELRRELTSN